ncbi:MAG: helix-turn-helix domain-containing protein, partial [Halobacteriota archaeon]
MLELSMDMEQYDCPFIDTTDDHDVVFSAVQWSFDEQAKELETRLLVEADDSSALDHGLETLGDHPNMHHLQLLVRRGERALIRT